MVLISWFLCAVPLSANAKEILKDLNVFGSASLNYRNISPRNPGFEYNIQHELYLTDLYFGADGKLHKKFPFIIEFQAPTSSRGGVRLYRLSVQFNSEIHWRSEIGKQLVPFGYFNEFYRGEQFISVTRPLLYASPDSLDLVLRLNSPHPVMTSGYTDIGARVSYRPNSAYRWMPSEITAYVINGFGEIDNRSRTFPYTGNLNVLQVPIGGVSRDWGHLNNNLADNNNGKVPGARVAFAPGDFKVPLFIDGGFGFDDVRFGISGMQGRYDLEEAIFGQGYRMIGTDLEARFMRVNIAGEYVYSDESFRRAQADSNGEVDFNQETDHLAAGKEINRGYYVQLSFPVVARPKWGENIFGFLVLNRMERFGPKLVYSENKDPYTKLPAEAFSPDKESVTTSIDKYTAGLNYKISGNFTIKGEYSCWKIKVPKAARVDQKSVSQSALSFVFHF